MLPPPLHIKVELVSTLKQCLALHQKLKQRTKVGLSYYYCCRNMSFPESILSYHSHCILSTSFRPEFVVSNHNCNIIIHIIIIYFIAFKFSTIHHFCRAKYFKIKKHEHFVDIQSCRAHNQVQFYM